MNNWKVIFATIVIFGAGVITGGLLVNYVHHSHPRAIHKPPALAAGQTPVTNDPARTAEVAKQRPPEILSRQFLQQVDEALHLKSDQHEAIGKIITEGQDQMRKVMQDVRLEIREVLTPDQQKQFDELLKHRFRKPAFNTNSPVAVPPATNASATNVPAV